MSTIRYTFEVVKWQASKMVKCPSCKKTLKRSKTFEQTINPFNKNAMGLPKSRTEILIELKARATEWGTKSEYCQDCLRPVAEPRSLPTMPSDTLTSGLPATPPPRWTGNRARVELEWHETQH